MSQQPHERPRELGPGLTLFPARTPTLPPATHTNSFALGEREVLLVEPATPHDDERRAWLDWVRGLEAQGRRPIAIVCTHHHPDHVGGASFLARQTGLPLWAHALTAARAPELPIARHLEDGEPLVLGGPTPQRWQVLHTPGHAPGHICLHLPERGEVVVGDMVASVGTILIEPTDGNMRIYLDQLERLEKLEAQRALPAHGDPIPEPSKLFALYIAHRLMRQEKVARALEAAGPAGATDVELVPVAYDDTPQALWPIALLSLRAHLIKLVDDGRARRDGERLFLS